MADEATPETTPPEGTDTGKQDTPTPEGETTPTPEGGGNEQDQQPTAPKKLADVLGGLDEAAQRIVKAELARKNSEAQGLRSRLNEAAPKIKAYDEAQEAQRTAEERVAARERQATEQTEKATQRMVRAEVRALASDRFADAEDAAAFLDATDYLRSDGEPDTDAIKTALDDLLARKPHLGKPDPKPRAPAPNPAQGSSGGGKPTKTTGTELGRDMFNARRNKQPAS